MGESEDSKGKISTCWISPLGSLPILQRAVSGTHCTFTSTHSASDVPQCTAIPLPLGLCNGGWRPRSRLSQPGHGPEDRVKRLAHPPPSCSIVATPPTCLL